MKAKNILLGICLVGVVTLVVGVITPEPVSAQMPQLSQAELENWVGGYTDEQCNDGVCSGTDYSCADYDYLCTQPSGPCAGSWTWRPGRKCGTFNRYMQCNEPSSLCYIVLPCECAAVGDCGPGEGGSGGYEGQCG